MQNIVRIFVIVAVCVSSFVPQMAVAQQRMDEPLLDPLIGNSQRDRHVNQVVKITEPRDEDSGELAPIETDEADGRGFTGFLTFLAPADTDLSLGVGPVFRPDYFGSDDYTWDVDPQIYVRFRNFQFLDDDGADIALIGFSNFRFGPSLRLVGDRDEKENTALVGLGDISETFEVGAFAATTFLNRYSVKFKVRRGVAGGHDGLIVDAYGTMLLFGSKWLSTSITAQTSWIGNRYTDTYFSVTPAQSLASGHAVYDGERGFRDIGGSANAFINIRDNWSLNPYIEYRYIFDNIANSPLILNEGSRHQFRTGFHLIRAFSL